MKTKSLILVGVLIIALIAMAVPVMAATDNAVTVVSGSVDPYVDLTVNSPTISFATFRPGFTETTTATLTVKQNVNSYINAFDTLTAPKADAGYMANATTAGAFQSTPNNLKLGDPIVVTGTDVGTFDGTTIDPLVATPGSLLFTNTGATALAGQALTVTFSQDVATTDVASISGYTYSIPITFTITST